MPVGGGFFSPPVKPADGSLWYSDPRYGWKPTGAGLTYDGSALLLGGAMAVTGAATLSGTLNLFGATGQVLVANSTDATNGTFFRLRNSSVDHSYVGSASGAAGAGSIIDYAIVVKTAASKFFLYTANTLALTVDASQNATFSGRAFISGADYSTILVPSVSAQIKLGRTSTSAGDVYLGGDSGGFNLYVGGTSTKHFVVDTGGGVICGAQAALATNATAGFIYIPSCAGIPTGAPAAYTGKVPLCYDSTNNFLYVYNGGAWKKSTVYA